MVRERGAAVRRGRATAQTHTIPAPVGGLNAIDSLAAMPPTDALVMDNWVPQNSYCTLRNGYVQWATGLGAYVETIMGYSNLTTTEKLFGIAGSKVYDCTLSGAVGAAVVSSLTNARWEYVNVSVPGGAYLYAANAVDKPLLYDGSSWVKVDGGTTPAITGVTTTTLRNPAVWKSRVWFVQNNTNLAWYLPVQSVGGAAVSKDLSTIFRLGGSLQSIMTFSLASSTTFDDFIGFLSTEGELAVYSGTDPSTAGLFNIIGVYYVGKPVGRRCWFKLGSDAVIITANGLVSVSKTVAVGVQQPQDILSFKIQPLVNTDIQSYSANFGWEGVVYPLGNKVIINVPENVNSRMHQWVMNTLNDQWCSYGLINSPWNAATFCVLGNNIYFGGNGFVAQCETGNADAGGTITGTIQPAYNYFGTDRQKMFTMIRPLLQTTGTVLPAMALNVDFQTTLPTTFPTFSGAGLALWNVALWNVSFWASGPIVQKNWQTVTGIGFAATIYLTVASKSSTVNLLSLDYVMKPGGIL